MNVLGLFFSIIGVIEDFNFKRFFSFLKNDFSFFFIGYLFFSFKINLMVLVEMYDFIFLIVFGVFTVISCVEIILKFKFVVKMVM